MRICVRIRYSSAADRCTRTFPKLGEVVIRDLTSNQIRDWHHALAAKAPRRRTKIGNSQRYGEKPGTDDEKQAPAGLGEPDPDDPQSCPELGIRK
jgi:hypothetical protein